MSYTHLTNVGSYDALLSSIQSVLNTDGWTFGRNYTGPGIDSSPTAGGHEVVASKGDCLVGLRSTTSSPGQNRLYLCDGVPPFGSPCHVTNLPSNSGISFGTSSSNAATLKDSADNHSTFRYLQQAAGPFPTADIFTDGANYCHVAVQISAGIWGHLQFGNLKKYGTWTGGGYYACTFWSLSSDGVSIPGSSNHQTPFDNDGLQFTTGMGHEWTVHYENGADKWLTVTEGTLNSVQRREGRSAGRGGFGKQWYSNALTPFSGNVPLARVMVFAKRRTDTPKTVRPIGEVRDFRMLNIQNLVPGTTYTLGPDNWMVFPIRTKKTPSVNDSLTPNSGYYGVAYRVIP